MAALDGPAVGQGHQHAGVGTGHRVRAGILDQFDAALGEDPLQHSRRVGVLVGQYLIPAGDHGDVDAQFGVGVYEFGTGDTGPHHDQVLGQGLQIVELTPVQDAFAVGPRGRQLAGAGAGGDQHHVGLVGTGAAVRRGRLDAVRCQTKRRVDQLAPTGDHLDARVL